MKKKLILLTTLLAMGLSSCVMYNGQGKPGASKDKASSSQEPVNYSIEPSTPPAPHGGGESGEPVAPETSVKVYLVFGENGLYKGNPVTTNNAALFLEHVVEFTGVVGSDLPGESDVTSSVSGSKFVAWTAYNNDGKLTEYTKVPNVDNKILYASFTGGQGGSHSGGGSGGGGGETPQPSEYTPSTVGTLPTTGMGLRFSDGSYMVGEDAGTYEGFTQQVIRMRSFKQGQAFALCNFAGDADSDYKPVDFLAVSINPFSFGGNDKQPVYDQYISTDTANKRYVVLKDFNAESVYLKFKYQSDEIYIGLGQ